MRLQFQSGPVDMDKLEVRLGDIVHNLSQLNRYLGTTNVSWSVAQHSCLCAWIAAVKQVPQELRLPVLLHDAHEAYTNDISPWLKEKLGGPLAVIEREINAKIAAKFGGFDPNLFNNETVKIIDQLALYVESKFLFGTKRVAELWTYLDTANDGDEQLAEIIGKLQNSLPTTPEKTKAVFLELIVAELAA